MKEFKEFSIQTVTALPRFDQKKKYDKFGNITPHPTQASIYINIPYCRSICRFCMLRKAAKLNEIVPEEFITLLIEEIELKHILFRDIVFDSVYFGGGTPSLLNSKQVERILNSVSKFYRLSDKVEYALEGEAKSFLRDQFLYDIHSLGIKKISFGLQTLDPVMRKFLGRTDTIDETTKVAELGNQIGFEEINVDYLYNLPSFSIDDVSMDINNILKIGYNSIDCHPLKYISCSSKMLADIYHTKMKLPTASERIMQYNLLRDRIIGAGMNEQLIDQYTSLDIDTTNLYIRKLNGMDGGQYVGFGPGARSYYGGFGFLNPKGIHDYSINLDKGLNYENNVASSDIDNFITRFPKRNQPLKKVEIRKSNFSEIYLNKFNKLSDNGYTIYDASKGEYRLSHLGRSWYQNLQEYLLSPDQGSYHALSSRKRDYKFDKFGGYFDVIGTHLKFEV